MKSAAYVYTVTSLYRKAIDSYIENGIVKIDQSELNNLRKIFNRKFTKGFLFNEENNNFINPYRPNHLGVEIGKVIDVKDNNAIVKLNDTLSINDGIRFVGKNDTGLILTSMFKNGKKIEAAYKNDIVSIKIKDEVKINSIVLKTTDYKLNKEIENKIKEETRKVGINGIINLYIDKPVELILNDEENIAEVTGDIVEKSINAPVSKQKIEEQLKKLGSTIYEFNNLEINMDKNIFISIKELNELRRKAVDILNDKRISKRHYIKGEYNIDVPDFEKEEKYSIQINSSKQYELIKDKNYGVIYIDDTRLYNSIDDNRKILKLERVINEYQNYNNQLLVGELGSVNHYKGVITDFSLNVVNSYSVALLHSLGVKRVTLSYELTDKQIEDIIKAYKKRYNKRPNLELIVYAHEEVMISKFNLNKYFNVNSNSYLKDRFNNLYPIVIKNNLMYIYNYKYRFYTDYKKYFDKGINSIRFNILDEKDIENIETK